MGRTGMRARTQGSERGPRPWGGFLESWVEGTGLGVKPLGTLRRYQAGGPWDREVGFQHRPGLLGGTHIGSAEDQPCPGLSPVLGSACRGWV